VFVRIDGPINVVIRPCRSGATRVHVTICARAHAVFQAVARLSAVGLSAKGYLPCTEGPASILIPEPLSESSIRSVLEMAFCRDLGSTKISLGDMFATLLVGHSAFTRNVFNFGPR